MKRFCYKSQEYMKSVHTCSNPFPSVDFLLTTVVRQDHWICHGTEESVSNLPILLSWNSFQSLLSACLDINSLSNSLWNFTNIIVPFSSQRGGRQCCHSDLEWEVKMLEALALLSSQSLLCLPSANSGLIDSCDSWPVHMVQWNSGNELYVTRWKHIKPSNMLS